MKKIYNYIYKITNLINQRYYIGIHTTSNLEDGYMGSGSKITLAIKKYGKKNFKKEIIRFFNSRKELYKYEKEIVNEELIKDRKSYNVALGGMGGLIMTSQIKKKISQANRKRYAEGLIPWNKGKKHSKETKAKIKLALSKVNKKGKNNPMFGKNSEDFMTIEAIKIKREKISKANKGKKRTKRTKKKLSENAKKRIWIIRIKDGKLSNTTSLKDERLVSGEWKLGMKLKCQK